MLNTTSCKKDLSASTLQVASMNCPNSPSFIIKSTLEEKRKQLFSLVVYLSNYEYER